MPQLNPPARSRSLMSIGLIVSMSAQTLLVPLAVAQGPAGPAAVPPVTTAPRTDPQAVLAEARELIKSGEYERVVELLVGNRETFRGDPAALSESYLLLIKTYIFIGNDQLQQPRGAPAADAVFEKASALIAECLSIPELRHTRPEPESDYPPEMVKRFRDVRDRLQGGIRIMELEPTSAGVVLDGDTLRAAADTAAIHAPDLLVGEHQIEIFAPGYTSIRERIAVTGGTTLERRYELRKRRGFSWYATRVAALGAVVVATVLVSQPADETGTGSLPGPPPPPTAPGR